MVVGMIGFGAREHFSSSAVGAGSWGVAAFRLWLLAEGVMRVSMTLREMSRV